MRKAKSNNDVKVAWQAKIYAKGVFQVYRTKAREEMGPLKAANDELVSSGEGISKIINEYFQLSSLKKICNI